MRKEAVIIKNTAFMFLRMLLVMFLTLFSTRLLLKALGMENYGIYDLIFGVVLLFNVLSGTMTTTLQRFYNISQDNTYKQSQIYSVSLQIFIAIGLLVLVLGFTLSDILITCLNIPTNSVESARIFFCLCIVNLVFLIFRMPFITLLISNEKMGLYASISICDALLKFSGIYLLNYLSLGNSSLVAYGYILAAVTCAITLLYITVCYIKLTMPKLRRHIKKEHYKEILSFSGWTLFGSTAALYSQQGLSVILNRFFGVLMNAANAISQQIYTAVYQFTNSFQTAYSPYLMKTYAQSNFTKMQILIILFSRVSVFLYLLIAIPLFTYTEPILQWWLHHIPEHAVLFTRLTLIVVLLEVLSAPLWLTVQASGSIQRYQIFISLLMILNLPLTYGCLMIWKQPILAFVSKIVMTALAYIYRIYMVRSLNCLIMRNYLNTVIMRLVLLIAIIAPLIYYYMHQHHTDWSAMIWHMLNILAIFTLLAPLLLLKRHEYRVIFGLLSKITKRV